MSWQDIMRRVLTPLGGVEPHTTSRYGEVEGRPPGGTKPHRGVDFNYNVPGQTGINLANPALRSPVTGIVTQADEGRYGTIAIRDANGYSHEILHGHSRHVSVGDPVVAGQLIGTMGNTGVTSDPRKGNHAHYQLKDSMGTTIDPSAYWDQQGRVDPNPSPPAFLGQYRQYLRDLGVNASNAELTNSDVAGRFDTGRQFAPGSATSSRPLYETRSSIPPSGEPAFSDDNKNIRRLVRVTPPTAAALTDMTTRPVAPPNEIPSDRSASFVDRFGDWASTPEVSAPRGPYQADPPQQGSRPLGIITGQPMPDWPFPPPIWGIHDEAKLRGIEDWTGSKRRRAKWE